MEVAENYIQEFRPIVNKKSDLIRPGSLRVFGYSLLSAVKRANSPNTWRKYRYYPQMSIPDYNYKGNKKPHLSQWGREHYVKL